MKKLLSISIVFLLILSLMIPAFASSKPLVVDNAELLSAQEEARITQRLQQASDKYNMDFVLVSTKTLDGKSIEAYADDYFDNNGYGIGRKGDRSGVLLLVYDDGTNQTRRHISTSGDGIKAFTDYGIQEAGKKLAALMDDGKWYEAGILFADICEKYAQAAEDGNPIDKPKEKKVALSIIVIIAAALVCAFLAVSVVKGKCKPVRFKSNATDYLVGGSLNVTGAYDNFRTTSVTRTPIQSNSSRGGSSTHTSSSGRTHGGGSF